MTSEESYVFDNDESWSMFVVSMMFADRSRQIELKDSKSAFSSRQETLEGDNAYEAGKSVFERGSGRAEVPQSRKAEIFRHFSLPVDRQRILESVDGTSQLRKIKKQQI